MDKKNNKNSQTLSDISPEARPFVEKIIANWKEVLAGFLGVLFVIFMFLGYKIYEDRKLKKDKVIISQVLEEKDINKKIDALNNLLPKISDRYKPGIYMNLAILYFQKKDYTKLYKILDEFKKLPQVNDNLKIIATIIQAKGLFLEKKPKKAYFQLKKILDKAPKDYEQFILWQLAFYAEKSNMWKEALEAYSKLRKVGSISNKEFLEEKISDIKEKLKKKS